MLTSLRLKDFRAFKNLEIEEFGQVNLFVGKNNCGKTSILEATEMLLMGGNPYSLTASNIRRGELLVRRDNEGLEKDIEVIHLFNGHILEKGASFEIEGNIDNKITSIHCEIITHVEESKNEPDMFSDNYELEPQFAVGIKHNLQEEPIVIPLTDSGGISYDVIRRLRLREDSGAKSVIFVRTEFLDNFELGRLWDAIALTDQESQVIETLKIIEPSIDRIAFLSESARRYSSGGIYVKLNNLDIRVPVGSLGDGVRHLLSMSLAVIRSAGGFVMIDEIDTGLHHSIMAEMWRVLIETARRLNVQIFATTHSQDCLESLAWLNKQEPDICQEVRLHRVELEHEKTTVYSPDEIMEAAKHHVEVRG